MSFHYKNTEKRMHGGKHHIQRVYVSGNKGFKSVCVGHKTKNCTVKRALTRQEISKIQKREFIHGLFDDCNNEILKKIK